MKRLFHGLIALLVAASAQATTLNPIQLLNPTGSASGQAIVSTGASTAPAWSNVSAAALASQAANTVVANVTGSAAAPTAFAMPSCSTSSSALQWTSGTGFACGASFATTAFVTTAPTINQPNLVGVTKGSGATAGSRGHVLNA